MNIQDLATVEALSDADLKSVVGGIDIPVPVGTPVPVRVGAGVTVNGAKVVQADIAASNGIVHVVDKPIFPDSPFGLP